MSKRSPFRYFRTSPDIIRPAGMLVRPEHLEVVGEGGLWSGKVVHSESLGADSFAYVDIGEEELLTVRLPGTAQIETGTALTVSPMGSHYHLFDANGHALAA